MMRRVLSADEMKDFFFFSGDIHPKATFVVAQPCVTSGQKEMATDSFIATYLRMCYFEKDVEKTDDVLSRVG